jgi:hypothetical protein
MAKETGERVASSLGHREGVMLAVGCCGCRVIYVSSSIAYYLAYVIHMLGNYITWHSYVSHCIIHEGLPAVRAYLEDAGQGTGRKRKGPCKHIQLGHLTRIQVRLGKLEDLDNLPAAAQQTMPTQPLKNEHTPHTSPRGLNMVNTRGQFNKHVVGITSWTHCVCQN